MPQVNAQNPTKTQGAPPSVLIVVTGTHRRGAEVFGEQLAGGLQDSGWQSSVVALRRSSTEAHIDAVPLFEGPDEKPISGLRPDVVAKLRRHIRSNQPDLVLAGGGPTLKYSVGAMTGMRDRPRLVYSSIGEPAYWARSAVSKRTLSTLLKRTDLVTAVSRATADQLTQQFGVDESKVRVAYPGVPDGMVLNVTRDESDRLRVLFLGSLSKEKDPLSALDVVKRMKEPSQIRFVGGGPMLAELKESVPSAAVQVEFPGAASDVVPHLSWADVLILTSRTEGLPGVLLEAGATGLPVVAFGVGGVAEAVTDGESGFVVDPGDVDTAAASLDRLALDRNLRASMGSAAQTKVRSQFLLSQAVERFVDLLAAELAGN